MSEQSGNEQIAKDLTNKVWLGCLSMDQLTSLMTSIKAVLDKKDSAHAAELEASRKLIDELKTMLSYGGLAEVRTCCKCRKPYPEFRVMSTMTCGNCRLAELQANVERLETTTAVLRGSCDSYMEQNSNLHKMVDELKASELVWLNQKSVAERRVDQLETDLRQAGEITDELKRENADLKQALEVGLKQDMANAILIHENQRLRKLLVDTVEALQYHVDCGHEGWATSKSVLERVKQAGL